MPTKKTDTEETIEQPKPKPTGRTSGHPFEVSPKPEGKTETRLYQTAVDRKEWLTEEEAIAKKFPWKK